MKTDEYLPEPAVDMTPKSASADAEPSAAEQARKDVREVLAAAGPMPILRCKACNSPRAASPCHKCGGELTPVAARVIEMGWEEPALPDVEPIRALARQKGYAIGVHGSLERDLDLIAAPWAEDACGPQELAAFIAAGINAIVLAPEDKPLGRWSCNIQVDGWFRLIDLSVSPRVPAQAPAGAKS